MVYLKKLFKRIKKLLNFHLREWLDRKLDLLKIRKLELV